jgi:hypothetical protein
MRRIVSLTALLSLVLVLLTSVVLYIEPPGRVAYWSGWRLMGLSKEQWGAVHINTGVLFLVALGLHVWYNWTPLVSYLKDKARNFRLFTREFNWAAGITLAFVLGTLLGLPPFSTITDGNIWFQDRAARLYGEPPYGHAELSTLKTFASRVGLNLDESLARLRAAGVAVSWPGVDASRPWPNARWSRPGPVRSCDPARSRPSRGSARNPAARHRRTQPGRHLPGVRPEHQGGRAAACRRGHRLPAGPEPQGDRPGRQQGAGRRLGDPARTMTGR